MNFDDIKSLAQMAVGDDLRPDWLKNLEGGTDPRETYFHFMWLLSHWFKPEVSVEIGTRGGKTALHLAHGNPFGFVHTIDIVSGCSKLVADLAQQYGLKNVRGVCFDSMQAKEALNACFMSPIETWPKIDLLFIDGNHTYTSSYGDYLHFRPFVRDGGLIVFDDTRLDVDMVRAWQRIADPKIELPELHYMGFGVAIKTPGVTPLEL